MAVNPFGETSDSVHAWKERYRQKEFEAQTLQGIVSETKMKLDAVTEERDQLLLSNSQLDAELSEVKRELLTFRNLAKERGEKVERLESSLHSSQIVQMTEEIERQRDQIEELQGRLARGAPSDDNDEGDVSELMTTLIPVMLHEFDPANDRYEDAFINLVETVIDKGDIMGQTIALLIKHGGRGPYDRVKQHVKDKASFGVAVDLLVEEEILKLVEDEIRIFTLQDDVTNVKNWNNLPIEEVFAQLGAVIEGGASDEAAGSLDIFRDILQERGIPASTVLFQIRKVKEGIQKGTMSRKEALEKIDEWREKIVGD